MTNLDFPCVCSHLAGHHTLEEMNVFNYCCIVGCHCDDYTPDNLRYLESKNER